jgi:aminopeptidase N
MKKKITVLICFLVCLFNNYAATDPRADSLEITRCRLNVNLADFAGKTMYAYSELTVKSKLNSASHIRLDLLKLTVDSVKAGNVAAAYTYNDSVLAVQFPVVLNAGDSSVLTIYYHGKPVQMPGDFGGFYWTNQYAFNIGVSFLEDNHSYGRVWFPCFDNFVTRSLYEFYVTTDTTRKALCNGLLQNTVNNGNGTQTWHWKLGQTIPSYLASVTVSDYQLLNDTVVGINGTLPVTLAARAADTTALKNSFLHLKDAFHIFENLFGPYSFDRVGYCAVPFNAGAMEHATNISYMLGMITGNLTYETTMAHELSHHWFGDLATCEEASEMWLNEGWAVYCEHLFLENLYNDSTAKDAIRKNHEGVLRKAHIDDGAYYAVSGVPSPQTYGRTVYDKGAEVAHTLRHYTNDANFFNCMKSYFSLYSFTHVNSETLRDFLSQCSSVDYTHAFDDWVFQPGFLHFSLGSVKTEQTSLVNFRTQLSIRQKLNHAQHYGTLVPVTVTYFDSLWNRIDEVVYATGECTMHERNFTNFKPVYVALDFHERMQDAITDEWKVLTNTGTFDFGTAKAKLTVTAVSDSVLVRVEHNWVAPDPLQTPVAGLHLHDYRYWTIDGLFDTTRLKADIRFDFNGTTNQNNGYLDNTFITTSEDSLVMLYRPDAESEWQLADSFKVNTLGSALNKVGYVTVYGLQKGQYSLAIRNPNVPDTVITIAPCIYSSVENATKSDVAFQLYPNPANDAVRAEFTKGDFESLLLTDIQGRAMYAVAVNNEETAKTLSLHNLAKGFYFVSLKKAGSKQFVTQKLIKQ